MAHSWVSRLKCFVQWMKKKRKTLEGKMEKYQKWSHYHKRTSILLRKINIWQEFGGWECVFVSLNASGVIIKVYASPPGNTKQRNPKQLTLEILPSVIMKNKWGTVTVIESRETQRRTLINTTKKWDRRDQRVFFFCPNPVILCHEVKALGIVFFSSFEVKESWGVSVRTPKKDLLPFSVELKLCCCCMFSCFDSL